MAQAIEGDAARRQTSLSRLLDFLLGETATTHLHAAVHSVVREPR